MYEYAPGITGEVRLSRQDGGYYVVLFDQDKTEICRTGLWRTEAKAREAARKLAENLSEK